MGLQTAQYLFQQHHIWLPQLAETIGTHDMITDYANGGAIVSHLGKGKSCWTF